LGLPFWEGLFYYINNMIKPSSLKKGDTVIIVSPSRQILPEQIKGAISTFEDWGLKVRLGNNVYSINGYLAGTDEERLFDLQTAVDDNQIKAIFCARGGYGMSRILDDINLDGLVTSPKWIIGFSDITALHLKMNKRSIESIHGLMPVQFEYDGVEESIQSLYHLLFSDSFEYTIPSIVGNKSGKTSGELIGGNLSLLVDSLGTSTEIETEGKILFLEEIDEYFYKIDRMLNQLKRANKLLHLKGLIVGDFSQLKDTVIPFGISMKGIIAHYFGHLEVPIAFNFPLGHESYNLAVPCGRKVTLEVTETEVKLLG
jgi:muramoyltetrapeptide carboxypeptidase